MDLIIGLAFAIFSILIFFALAYSAIRLFRRLDRKEQ